MRSVVQKMYVERHTTHYGIGVGIVFTLICCVRCLLITESPKTPIHYRYQI